MNDVSTIQSEKLDGRWVLVTGGAGFIGSHLIDALLQAGARVRVLDNLSTGRIENLRQWTHAETASPAMHERLELVQGDIRDATLCRRCCDGVAIVFHEAARGSVPRSIKDPATTIAVNVAGTANVFAAARDAGVERVVYASSSSVYGDTAELPKREGREGRLLSPYALSKAMNEELAEVFGSCYGLELIGLRYFNVYGPRQSPEGPYAAVIPRFLDACRSSIRPIIHGDGEQSRDFTYVDDAVQANLGAALAPAAACGRAYNVAGGRRVTILRIFELIRDLCGSNAEPLHEAPRPGDVRHSLADLSAIHAAFGFEPRTDLATGLERTVRAFLSQET